MKEENNFIKLNFERMEIFTDITKTHSVVQDVRKAFADLIYNNCNGIVAHALALKIYQSSGEVELNKEEVQLIDEVTSRLCTPAFMDSVKSHIQ